jgi:hypothetical protein
MSMGRQLAVAVILLALGTGGCGADRTSWPESPSDGSSVATVESVTVRQSGGIAGIDQTWRVSADTPGVARVLAAAGDEALRAAATGTPATDLCCDLFQYDITIRYSDGLTVRLRTTDVAEADPAVRRLLDAVIGTVADSPDR